MEHDPLKKACERGACAEFRFPLTCILPPQWVGERHPAEILKYAGCGEISTIQGHRNAIACHGHDKSGSIADHQNIVLDGIFSAERYLPDTQPARMYRLRLR